MRKQKGVTLIALVVTIIIMLILIGTVLHYALGENGIFNTTEKGIEETEVSSELEQLHTIVEQVLNDNVIEGYGSIITMKSLYISTKEVTGYTNEGLLNVLVSENENGDIEFTFKKSKRKYIITKDGKIDENFEVVSSLENEQDIFNGITDANEIME